MLKAIESFTNKEKRTLNYIINLPENYDESTKELFPVILFLHGIGERGTDINLVKKYGIHRYTAILQIPFIIISPQCHSNKGSEL